MASRHDALQHRSFELTANTERLAQEKKARHRFPGRSGWLFMGRDGISTLDPGIWGRLRMRLTRVAIASSGLSHPTASGGVGRFDDVSGEEFNNCRPPAAPL